MATPPNPLFKVFVQISLSVNLSFNQNSPDILALCEKFLSDMLPSFNPKGFSVTHTAVYVKERLPFA